MPMLRRVALLCCVIWLLSACGATNESTPSLVNTPRSLPTPASQAVLGYSTPLPNAAPSATPVREQIDVQLSSQRTQVSADRMMRDIRALQNFETRHVNSSDPDNPNRGILAAHDYLLQEMQLIASLTPPDVAFAIDSQGFEGFFNDTTTEQYNIIGRLQGTELGAGTIVIGAHYDSRTDNLNNANDYAPGADDNGSGVAGVLELARILSQSRHRASIIFVLFSAEEVGRQGSRAFVGDYVRRHSVDVIAMLNLDTIGSNNDPNGTINDREIRLFSDDDPTNTSPSRHLARMIEFFGQNHSYPLGIDFQPALDRDGRYGDQQSFSDRGYPAVRFIEALEDTPNREGDDLIDHIEPDYLLQSTQTILGVVRSLADGLQPPTNISLTDLGSVSENGNSQAQLTWNEVPDASRYIVVLRPIGSLTYDVSQQFTVEASGVIWDRFTNFEALAIASVDENGLIGRLSEEYILTTRRR